MPAEARRVSAELFCPLFPVANAGGGPLKERSDRGGGSGAEEGFTQCGLSLPLTHEFVDFEQLAYGAIRVLKMAPDDHAHL